MQLCLILFFTFFLSEGELSKCGVRRYHSILSRPPLFFWRKEKHVLFLQKGIYWADTSADPLCDDEVVFINIITQLFGRVGPEVGSPWIINSTLSFFFFLVQYKQARNGGQVEVGFLIYLHGEQCWHLTTSAIIHYGAKLCNCNMHSTQRRAANCTKNVSRLDSCVFFAS